MQNGAAEKSDRICFVLAPLGEADSDVRKRSDQVLKHVIQPAVKSAGYEAVRADQISEPGIITTQIIQHIIDDPLVIADLSGRNPNVFYELAIRHALRKPYVQLIQRGERIPFDVAAIRTIDVDHHDLDCVDSAKAEIVRQIKAMEAQGEDIDSPISVAIDLEVLRQSGNPEQRQLADVLGAVGELRTGIALVEKRLADPAVLLPIAYLRESLTSELRAMLAEVLERSRRVRMPGPLMEELFAFLDRLSVILEPSDGKEPPKVRIEEARELLRRSDRLMEVLAVESGLPPVVLQEMIDRRMRRRKAN
jgi:hypothetical protein